MLTNTETKTMKMTCEMVIRGGSGNSKHGLYARPGKPFTFIFDYTEGIPSDVALKAFIAGHFDGKKPRGVALEILSVSAVVD